MNNKKYYLLIFALLLAFPLLVLGQEAILRLPPYTVSGKYLNQQIADDTVANGKLPNRVYVLERGRLYLANAVFNNNGKWTLRLRANDTISGVNKPVIMLYPTGTGTTPQNPPGNLFALQGDLYMKNLIVTGYYEPVDSNLNNLQGALINMPAASPGSSIYIDSCILSNTNGNHIRTDGAPRVIKVTNSVFANMGYLGKSNLGGGKAVDIRDVSCDSLVMVNNTFVNWQDRVIRHYPLTGPTGPLKYFLFDHNTLANGQSYHGLLSLGSMGSRAIITNNLFVDPFSLGNDTDAVRQAEFVPSGEKDPYGGARMTWIFSVPNDSTRWTVANNYYSVSDSGQSFYNDYASSGVTGEGSPLSWHINGRLGADSTKAFKKVTLSLNKIPLVMTKANRWYRWVNGGNKTKNTPTSKWNNSFDFDRKGYLFLRDTLNGTYPTTSVAYTGALAGYPVGDLNWFPTRKAQWAADPATSVNDHNSVIPESYSLSQNYPNPFNPTTTFEYSLSKSGRVVLEVFNVLGQSVARVIDGQQNAGTYRISYDASHLSSGVYLYRLSTGDFVRTMKMVLMK
jgi:hypothetical protein